MWARLVAITLVILTLTCLVRLLLSVINSGTIEHDFGMIIPGVNWLFRANDAGLRIALLVMVMTGLSLLNSKLPPMQLVALLLASWGTMVTIFAGNLLLLFGGCQLIYLGTGLWLHIRNKGSDLRYIVMAWQQLGALGVSIASLVLLNGSKTLGFSVLSTSNLNEFIIFVWALSSVLSLLGAVSMLATFEDSTEHGLMIGFAIVPTLMIWLRLREIIGLALPGKVAIVVGVVGIIVLTLAWLRALSSGIRLLELGKCFCLAMLGTLLMMLALNTDTTWTAAVTIWVAIYLALLVLPSLQSNRFAERLLGAIAIASYPISFSSVGVVLAVSATTALGLGSIWLVLLMASAFLGVLFTAIKALRIDSGGNRQSFISTKWMAIFVLLVGGILPGTVMTRLVIPISNVNALSIVDAARINIAGTEVINGYLSVVLLLVISVAISAAFLGNILSTPTVNELLVNHAHPNLSARFFLNVKEKLVINLQWVIGFRKFLLTLLESSDRILAAQPNLITLALTAFVLTLIFR